MTEKQVEIEFTAPDLKTASQPGIQWRPDEATPEQIKHWHETESKWWADRALTFVGYATLVQVTMIGLMLLTFVLIDMGVKL